MLGWPLEAALVHPRRAILLVIACCLPLLAAPARAQDAAGLEARITLNEPLILLGELLQRLSDVSGETLAVDETHAPIGGFGLTAIVHQQPVSAVMAGIVELYSAPPDRWQWRREERQGRTVHVLSNSLASREFQDFRRQVAEAALLAQMRQVRAFVDLPSRDRILRSREEPSLVPLAREAHRRAGLLEFVERLSPETLTDLFFGGRREVRLADMTPEQRSAVVREYQTFGILNDPDIIQPDQLPSVTLHGGTIDGAPGIYISVAIIRPQAVLGGPTLLVELRRQWDAVWRGTEPEPAALRPLPAPEASSFRDELLVSDVTYGEIASILGRHGRLNVLLDQPPFPESRRSRDEMQLAGVLPEVLARLEPSLAWKQAGDFLLLRPADWDSAPRDAVVPWSTWQALRKQATAGDGYLQPESWTRLAALSAAQLEQLAPEFPDAGTLRLHSDMRAALQIGFTYSARELDFLRRPSGLAFAAMSAEVQRELLKLRPNLKPEYTRLHITWFAPLGGEPAKLRWYAVFDERKAEVRLEALQRRREPAP